MNKNRAHFLVDLLAYLAFVGLAATGTLLAYRLPAGSGGAAVLGLTRHEWGDVHFYLAAGLVALMVLHVALHWRWVTNTFGALLAARTPRRPGAGLGGTTVLLVLGVATTALLAAPWILGVEGAGRGRGEGEGRGAGYRGGRVTGGQSEITAAGPQAAADTASVESAPKDRAAGRGAATGRGAGARGSDIRGSMTLAEAAATEGVDFRRLVAALNLPANTPGTARLGPLRQEHGFTMEDVRGAVSRLRTAK
jgi:hypothetical protein